MNQKENQQEQINIAMRVIADHIRTIAFAITDGQLPSNAKAGYVIRRILRRAVRYGYTFLGQKEAFMYKLIPVLIEVMGDAYPELKAQQTLIEKVTKEEEISFLHTLETGIKLLDKEIQNLSKGGTLSGKIAFTLYDTYGFPLDLTELILRENNLSVDLEEFNTEMQKQKERARNAAAVETDDWVIVNEGESEFVGYDYNEVKTKILRYRKVKQKNKEFYQIVLEKTPFYAESGGQVGDCGTLRHCGESRNLLNSEEIAGQARNDGSIEIFDTKKENNLSVHLANYLPFADTKAPCGGLGAITFVAQIDLEKRNATARNHTATHILHEALREILGTHVEQKGSYVSPEVLRFDFAHFQKMTKEEIRQVEHLANEHIRNNFNIQEMRELPIAEAQKMGAIALFGEKYGENVRVIKFGNSAELCGGTHVKATGEIGMVRIMSESSIAAGIRRIEAITGGTIENMLDYQQDMIADLKEFFHNTPNLMTAVKRALEENAELKKQVEDVVYERISTMCDKLLSGELGEKRVGAIHIDTNVKDVFDVEDVTIIKFKANIPAEHAKHLAFLLKSKQFEKLYVVIGSVFDNKPSLTILLSDDLVTAGLNATNIIRTAAKEIQGGGGGQPFFAQAGGKNADGIDRAMEIAVNH